MEAEKIIDDGGEPEPGARSLRALIEDGDLEFSIEIKRPARGDLYKVASYIRSRKSSGSGRASSRRPAREFALAAPLLCLFSGFVCDFARVRGRHGLN